MLRIRPASVLVALVLWGWGPRADAADVKGNLFSRENLVAWCIVPFDDRERTPVERAQMLKRLGITKYAYDYRAQHVPTFDDEMRAVKEHGIELTAWWFPTVLNDEARLILDVLRRHEIKTQLWVTGGGGPTSSPEEQHARVQSEAERLRPIAQAAAEIGCTVALYNHGGWFGEPENQVAIIRALNLPNVGIVYNQHHGHDHVDRFAALLETIQPHLVCLNLNGMVREGDRKGQKIVPLGQGELDLKLLKIIRESGYAGPIGILNHTQENAEARLQDNLDGLSWLLPQLDGKPAPPKPQPRTWSPPKPVTRGEGVLLEGRDEYRFPPLTVEVRATLEQKQNYNILVASDEKRSGAHWELFSMAGTGNLTAYFPGMTPDHVRSSAMICDGRPHHVGMIFEERRVRLFVDGHQVADQEIASSGRSAVPGGLGIGRLVEGTLGCAGRIAWVRISRGVREFVAVDEENQADDSTLLYWRPQEAGSTPVSGTSPEYSPDVVTRILASATQMGNPQRGVAVFASAKFACLNCHRIGRHGGSVGPELTEIGKKQKPGEIVESLFWPRREVKPEFVAHSVVTAEGKIVRGYRVKEANDRLVLRDPTSGVVHDLDLNTIEARQEIGTLMPDGLTAGMSPQQQADLVRFLIELGRDEGLSRSAIDGILAHAYAHLHGPAEFPFDRAPFHPEHWPGWQEPVNRDRIYDYYAKQAEYFRTQPGRPPLLPAFPGLDGGTLGHWGNQNEQAWADGRWNETDLGSLQAGIFRGAGKTVPRGVCIRLGEKRELSACFNPDTLTYDVLWKEGFVTFSSVRHGFLHGLQLEGTITGERGGVSPPMTQTTDSDRGADTAPLAWRGFYRHGDRVVFVYRIGDVEYLDAPWVENGEFVRTVAPAESHPLRHLTEGGPLLWPQLLTTRIDHGSGSPYAVDTIQLPFENPWKALIFCGDHAFHPDGSTYVCTMQGDVWRVTGYAFPSTQATWKRFASGLHHPLGMVIDDEGIFVLGRDQITRLHDLNGNGEADFHECFSHAYRTSPAGHDFICGLERDADGYFYTASGNQGVVRVSPDGKSAEVIATGFRNPDGLGLTPDGLVTVPCSEGEWTPASMICAFRPVSGEASAHLSEQPDRSIGGVTSPVRRPFFGYRGPQPGEIPDLPLVYLPRGLDNSSGGQTCIDSDRWGPLNGQMLHFSFGAGAHFLLLRDEVDGQFQGAVVPLPGEFRSGAHRGRFSPHDGQLYVSGMAGWGSYTPDDGCFHRVRYTGAAVQLPVDIRMHQNGVLLRFSGPLDPSVAGDPRSHFAQCWNYRYGPGYGSPELSSRHPGTIGHDPVEITAAHVLDDGRSLFLELPDLQPVNQLHLRVRSAGSHAVDLFATVHALDVPFEGFSGYRPVKKVIAPHPIHADLILATKMVPNRWRGRIPEAREIRIECGSNLTFATQSVHVQAGEAIRLTLLNPDVVPHNWALVKPGTLQRVGELANRLVADPDAVARHYIPETDDVLVHTDVVLPRGEFTIHFRAPQEPGRYPYLCTFPGHWLVMNGELIVTDAAE